jgi:putative transposase
MSTNANCARTAYNWTVSKFKNWKKGDPYQSKFDLAKELRSEYNNNPDFQFYKAADSQSVKQAVYDAHTALMNFFHGRGFPNFKHRHRCLPKFFIIADRISVGTMQVKLPKIGLMPTSEQLPRNAKFYNSRVSFNNKYWYLSVGVEIHPAVSNSNGDHIGIDLGIKTLATLSDGRVYENPAKSKKVRKLTKKLKSAQRKRAKKYKKGDVTKNYLKAKKHEQHIYQKITNIRSNACHQMTADVVKTKPSVIVIEDLNVKGMLKNHKLARAIAEVSFAEIRRQLEYKCQRNGIELKVADRFYPSSKLCSVCGCKKEKLSLSERTYHCEHCGATIDRDLNAAINLAKLAVA